MYPHISLKSKAVDDGDQPFDAVQRCASDGPIGEDMAAAPREDRVECGDRVSGAGHGDEVERFEEARRRGQEG